MPCHSRMIGSHCLCSLLGPSKAKITSTTAANECTWLLESHDLEHWSSLISEPLCWNKCKADVARATKKCQTASSTGFKFTLSRSTCNRVHRAQKAGSIYGSCSVDFLRQCEMCKYQLSRIVRKIWLTGLCSIAVALPRVRNRFFQHIGSLLHAWRQTNHRSAVNIQVCAGFYWKPLILQDCQVCPTFSQEAPNQSKCRAFPAFLHGFLKQHPLLSRPRLEFAEMRSSATPDSKQYVTTYSKYVRMSSYLLRSSTYIHIDFYNVENAEENAAKYLPCVCIESSQDCSQFLCASFT